jgi:hypothetical protein
VKVPEMRVLIFGVNWFEIADQWGNTASILGLVIALIAFPVTWRIQSKIRRACRETLHKVALVVLSSTVEDLHRQLTSAREAGRLGLWLRAFDCCHSARWGFIRLVGNPHLTPDEIVRLRTGADDLRQVIQYLEANKLRADPSPAFQQDKRDAIDALLVLLTSIQGRLGTKTWQV